MSKEFELICQILGDRMCWAGTAKSPLGWVHRRFSIQSEAWLTPDGKRLEYNEKLDFSDGATEQRSWKLHKLPNGLTLEAENVKMLRPARQIGESGLEFYYSVRIGGLIYHYCDLFFLRDDGTVENRGVARKFAFPLLKISVLGEKA